ncbi:uncharacterized protein LOC111476812 [Cucurbita maxima]|uniref:Uncharacterized protein LOC111476812 n=1 Tax=Cucurbita maxima TaxID=3661 RepID=A0A6J1IM05_CUCMA|nr:uncharacterized protein LOC111476812 [Cucurbita maxima]
MGHMVRALRHWPMLQNHCFGCTVHHFLSSPPWVAKRIDSLRLTLATVHSARREVQHGSKGLRLSKAQAPAEFQEDESVDEDLDVRKSRNQLKREARRAVQWGMDLAAFSTPQIKRILRVASLEKDVFDAIMLVKRLGRDVREGKRRQFSYIGKLLRDVQPELMDSLIQATKDGDHSTLQTLSGSVAVDDDEDTDSEYEEEEEEGPHVDIATRWLDGLVSKDKNVTNEIYSLQTVEFDRQELRRLVRKVHMVEERKAATEENEDEVNVAITTAKKPLARFLCRMAKQLPPYEL